MNVEAENLLIINDFIKYCGAKKTMSIGQQSNAIK